MPLVDIELLPQPRDWLAPFGTWRDDVLEVRLDPEMPRGATVLVSPEFTLKADQLVTFTFSATFSGHADYALYINGHRRHLLPSRRGILVDSRLFEALEGDARMSIAFRPRKSGLYWLALALLAHPNGSTPTISKMSIATKTVGTGAVFRGRLADIGELASEGDQGRYLPHWNRIQRFIHRRCRASRGFNNFVAAIEMRLGREELLSLPQYMGLCPTGQCNALCDFCSVTINRTGIIKKQLPYERLESFLAPIANTIQMYGIEGNGEPTLYTRFPELVERLTRGGTAAYLITNGSRLQIDELPLLMTLDSVNFSLNAATAETHRRVMKLKNFDEITAAIRALARDRGRLGYGHRRVPAIFTSIVVTNDNIHEVQEFLRFVEQDLKVDIVLVRPLSELGNDLGVVEDVRRIVPYESDVKDMIDAVAEYMHDPPKGLVGPREIEIRIAPDTFHSFRPDPVGRVVMPRGFEGRLLAPRRNDWSALNPDVVTSWNLNTARIVLPAIEGELLRSLPVPVEPDRELIFKAQVAVSGGPVRFLVEDSEHLVVAEVMLADTGGRTLPLKLQLQTGQTSALSLVFVGQGRAASVDIDFERLRTPAPFVSKEFGIPPSRRWELCVLGAEVEWNDSVLRLLSVKGGGPYLLKSYAIPCARNTIIEIPVEVEVRDGSIDVAVLDEAGQYLQFFSFASGHASSRLFFDTGNNDGVQLVVSATPGRRVDATIRWLKPRLILEQEGHGGLPIRLPSASEWTTCVPELFVDRHPDYVSLSWRGEGGPYLLRSNKVRCSPDSAAEAQVLLEVQEGRVGVGVLDDAGANWLTTKTLDAGNHLLDLQFDTKANDAVAFVLFAVPGSPLTGRIGFSENGAKESALAPLRLDRIAASTLTPAAGEPRNNASAAVASPTRAPALLATYQGADANQQFPDRRLEAVPEIKNAPSVASAVDVSSPLAGVMAQEVADLGSLIGNERELAPSENDTAQRSGPEGAASASRQAMPKNDRSRVRYYCQKPWTDLHNFTVDGRMDVCCIATGASQERYQLGNLTQHTFQETWNGPMMREFRRTVNGTNKLPPCARCPMSYAYQGLWFDPQHTRKAVNQRIALVLKKMRLSWLVGITESVSGFIIERTFFRGFNREKRWMS
jgi:MoaA/NifB/PqqE/SkfB family radical SAM enzyme